MRIKLTFLFLSFCILLSAQGYTIENYSVDVNINQNGAYYIQEIIDVHFSDRRRGIIRNLETKYKINNGIVDLELQDIKVDGHKFKVSNNGNEISIRIGDPSIFLTGKQRYAISYTIKNGIITYPEHLEFHTDIIPNQWDTKIEKADFKIHFPKSITFQPEDMKVTGGRSGETQDVAVITQANSKTVVGNTKRELPKNNGVTVAIKLPKKYLDVASNNVSYYKTPAKKESSNEQPWYFALPVLVFTVFISFWQRLRNKSKFVSDEKRIYPPEGITSAHIGAFVDQTAHTRDIVSLLPYWASEGYIEMKKMGDETYLYKIKNIEPSFPEYEHIIFDELFKNSDVSKISDLKTKFFTTLSKARGMLTSEVNNQEYYDPEYMRIFRSWRVVVFPMLMIIIGIFLIVKFSFVFLGIGFFVAALGGVILSLFNLPLTEKGARLKAEIEGFKKFLKDPDEKTIAQVMNEDPSYFDTMFPFAVAFGFEKIFLEKMEPHMQYAPVWYNTGTQDRTFTAFKDGFKPEEIQSVFSSAPHSSGGSSGGSFSSGSGVGGGGGSSW